MVYNKNIKAFFTQNFIVLTLLIIMYVTACCLHLLDPQLTLHRTSSLNGDVSCQDSMFDYS